MGETGKGMFDLSGRVALVTGSSRGMGKAIAETYAKAGAKVVISSRKAEACEATAAAIRGAGGEALAVPANISDASSLEPLRDAALNEWGRIDVLVCNAAANPYYGPMKGIDDGAWQKVIDTNLTNVLKLCNLIMPGMAERGDGSVILISSVGAFKGSKNLGAYAISKAALLQLVRNLAVEWGPDNLRANAIAPGLIKTDFAKALWEDPEARAQAEAAYPLGRLGEPEDIAGAALLLASPAGAFISGQCITIDGGATAAGNQYG